MSEHVVMLEHLASEDRYYELVDELTEMGIDTVRAIGIWRRKSFNPRYNIRWFPTEGMTGMHILYMGNGSYAFAVRVYDEIDYLMLKLRYAGNIDDNKLCI